MGHFSMTKYSSVFKAKVTKEYCRGGISYYELCKKYDIPSTKTVETWVNRAEQDGLPAIKVKRTHRHFSQAFKLSVLDYVQTNEVSQTQAALHFGISSCLICTWTRIVRSQGVAGLRPKPKGRQTTTTKHNRKKNGAKIFKTIEPTERERYQQEILELKTKLHHAEMDRDILKVLATMPKQSQTHSTQNRKRTS